MAQHAPLGGHGVDLVIFDCDGVLVDSERLTVVVEARMLTEMGGPITPEEVVRRFVGGSSDAMLAEIERHLGPELTATGATVFDSMSELRAILLGDRDPGYR